MTHPSFAASPFRGRGGEITRKGERRRPPQPPALDLPQHRPICQSTVELETQLWSASAASAWEASDHDCETQDWSDHDWEAHDWSLHDWEAQDWSACAADTQLWSLNDVPPDKRGELNPGGAQ